MTVSYEDKRVWLNINTELKDELLHRIVSTLECLVCSEMMHVPFLAQCGHSFCYGCLNAWFETKVNCPTCRKDMDDAPVLNLQLKDVSSSVSDLVIDTLEDELRKDELRSARATALDEFERASRGNALFGDAFKNAPTLIDKSDGVPRCGNCHWEAHGNVCLHCGSRFRIPRDDLYYDSEDGDAYNEDEEEVELYGVADAENAYDSDDSFLDNRNLTQINGDRHASAEDAVLSSGDERSEQLWDGFGHNGEMWQPHSDADTDLTADVDLDSHAVLLGSDELGDVVDRLHRRAVDNYIDLSASESGDDSDTPRARRTTHIIDLDSD